MIIDLILDRKEGKNKIIKDGKLYTTKEYNARQFYNNVMNYYSIFPEIVEPVANALDGGTNEDVQKELSLYIEKNGYNLDLIKYIKRVDWV